jgi:hypothetical protein
MKNPRDWKETGKIRQISDGGDYQKVTNVKPRSQTVKDGKTKEECEQQRGKRFVAKVSTE